MKTLILTEPSVEPVTLAEVKAHLVIEHTESDEQLVSMITAARRHVEQVTRRALVRQQWRQYLDRFTYEIALAPAPVREVAQVQYIDEDGATQTVATSVYDFNEAEQVIRLAFGQTWPAARWHPNAVWVDVWSGYYNAASSPIPLRADVPRDIRQAIMMVIDDLYEHRGKAVVGTIYSNTKTIEALLAPYWLPDQ